MKPIFRMPIDANIPPEWITYTSEAVFKVVVPSWSIAGDSHTIQIDKTSRAMHCDCLSAQYGKPCHHVKGLIWFCYKNKHHRKGVADTSIDSLAQFSPDDLGKRRKAVYELLATSLLPISDNEIGRRLDWPINCVTGRRGELVKMGVVVEAGTSWDSATSRNVIVWMVA